MFGDVIVDRGNQFCFATEYAAAYSLIGEITEESLNHVEPGSAGRREMHLKSRMTSEPTLNFGMLVRSIVIGDQMDLQVTWRLGIDETQEPEPSTCR